MLVEKRERERENREKRGEGNRDERSREQGMGHEQGGKIGNGWKRYKSRSVRTRSMAKSGKEKERKKGARRGEGWFYEVDAALVCDELVGFLVNLTRDLFPLSLHTLSILFPFFIIYREPMGMPMPHISS